MRAGLQTSSEHLGERLPLASQLRLTALPERRVAADYRGSFRLTDGRRVTRQSRSAHHEPSVNPLNVDLATVPLHSNSDK